MPISNAVINQKPSGMKDPNGREVDNSSGGSNSNNGSSNSEETRKWNPIPTVKRNCTDITETKYYQGWPFNSYVDERKEANQALLAQLVPPASTIQDVLNKKGAQAIWGVVLGDPVTPAVIKTFYNLGKKWNWWGKKKDDDTEWKGRKPAGCASIAFLQLLYYYKNVSEIRENFPELKSLGVDYAFDSNTVDFEVQYRQNGDYEKLEDADVEIVKSIMGKIDKAIPVSVFTKAGTAVLATYMKKAAENLHLKQFAEPLNKPDNEKAAENIYRALCNGILPIVYLHDINLGTNNVEKKVVYHYFLIDGCLFDNAVFEKTRSYFQSCKFMHNDGWGDGSEKADNLKEVTRNVTSLEQHLDMVFFFAPEKKFHPNIDTSKLIV